MYKLTLVLRYLRRKLAPLFASLAVMLCTAMVIIVISIMGGFLQMMRDAVRTLTGDVVVVSDLTGFGHYEELLGRLRQRPEIESATPVIRAYGLMDIEGQIRRIEVFGIEPQGLDSVTGYRRTLHWSGDDYVRAVMGGLPPMDQMTPQDRAYYEQLRAQVRKPDLVEQAMRFEPPPEWGETLPGIVPGIEVNPMSFRDAEGHYNMMASAVRQRVTLTVLRLTQRGQPVEPAVQQFTVVNEFKSGLYDLDATRVFVSFETLQRMLRMDAYQAVDPETGEPTGVEAPGRATELMVRGKAGVPVAEVAAIVGEEVRAFSQQYPTQMLGIMTWEDQHRTFLAAVEKEKGLLTILFAFISIVAVVMIGVIFNMIVLEKTRDIGVLRALGASRTGVASIFMGYGLAVGVLGSLMGFVLAAAIVLNINELQALLFQWFGFQMWDPRVYYFDRIPSNLEPREVIVILVAAIFSSLVGSIIPAFLAARLDPVETLRYE